MSDIPEDRRYGDRRYGVQGVRETQAREIRTAAYAERRRIAAERMKKLLEEEKQIESQREDVMKVVKKENKKRFYQDLVFSFTERKLIDLFNNSAKEQLEGKIKLDKEKVVTDFFEKKKVFIDIGTLRNISNFYKDISEIDLLAVYALRLLILTATRTKEVIEAKFTEFDLDKKVWTIPEHKMKAGVEHKVPLSDEAIQIINFMRKKHNHEYVFHNKATGKHISNNAMLVFVKKHHLKTKITVHGFRATFRTWAEETGKYQHHAIEFCLAHQLPTKVEKSYLRTNLFGMRKIIMNDWEQFLIKNK